LKNKCPFAQRPLCFSDHFAQGSEPAQKDELLLQTMNFILCWYFREEICGKLGIGWRRGGTKQQQKGVS